MREQVREILQELPKLAEVAHNIPDDANLWESGMDSLTSVQLLLRLEEKFDVEFPDELLTWDAFRSIEALSDALRVQIEHKQPVV